MKPEKKLQPKFLLQKNLKYKHLVANIFIYHQNTK